MKITKLIVSLLLFAATVHAQGIKFEEKLTWEQVKTKAKQEGKFIFVDCYATWCGPCKQMDQQVYIDDTVGNVFNKGFISFRLQMDRTAKDSEEIKKQYADAEIFNSQYNVNAYPTLLFFSPNGELSVHEAGFRGPRELIALSDIAKDPGKQYFALLAQYHKGERNYVQMPNLAMMAKVNGNLKTANEIAIEYYSYIFKNLSKEQLLTANNYRFHVKFENLLSTKDLFFEICMTDPERINRLAETVAGRYNPDAANVFIQLAVIHDEIDPMVYDNNGVPNNEEPKWTVIENKIANKYGKKLNASKMIFDAKQRYYEKKEDWESFANVIDAHYRDHPAKTFDGLNSDWWRLNAIAYGYFLKVKEPELLNRALTWANESLRLDSLASRPNPQIYDTKAQLLYKLGRVAEAIRWEEKAIEIDAKQAIEKGKPKGLYFDKYSEYINKMKKGEPTWPARTN